MSVCVCVMNARPVLSHNQTNNLLINEFIINNHSELFMVIWLHKQSHVRYYI